MFYYLVLKSKYMRLLLFMACCSIIFLSACHKDYTCDCVGYDKGGERVLHTENYELASRKDAENICDSAKRDFINANADITGPVCELR